MEYLCAKEGKKAKPNYESSSTLAVCDRFFIEQDDVCQVEY